jgi:regulatory protein
VAAPTPSALETALKLLSIRARSRRELKQALARKGFGEGHQDSALTRLSEMGYLDDARFALERASSLLRKGRLGPRAVVHRLCAHGLSKEEASRALAQAESALEITPLDAARGLLRSKGLLGRALQSKERARAERMLRARGFAESTIEAVLGPPLDPEPQGS